MRTINIVAMDLEYYYFYEIRCNDAKIKQKYGGKTKNKKERWKEHKNVCKNTNSPAYNLKVYRFIRANGNIDNWNMHIIKEGACTEELSKGFERKIIEFNCILNSVIPGQTQAEYHNKEKTIAHYKQYRIKNKDKINAKSKQYHIDNREKILAIKQKKILCECGCISNKGHILRHRKTNKHKILMLMLNKN
tara:strand:- start:614 stop:1186 length:573 start_codon:yes stop_codon:yes gene_type:complete